MIKRLLQLGSLVLLAMAAYNLYKGPGTSDTLPWIANVVTMLAVIALLYVSRASNKAGLKDRFVTVSTVVIIGFCFFGFGSKFVEFVRLVSNNSEAAQEGIFAVAPLANYLLASAGFLCLLGWAASQGMFRQLEQPKQTMLDVDAKLDAGMDDLKYCNSVMK